MEVSLDESVVGAVGGVFSGGTREVSGVVLSGGVTELAEEAREA